ncbi:hypothetical protein [Amycolatopsis sp. SID8362]|uniref:hypothetical protein n=1 Tax=Amycolatopsis sp. SID8362 TaxID=2690346 RepID=UPI0013704037|nr:hypothetical protein [Amycolatopsis sp. SID8362]NBH04876.1 hypothetical protein [Amycolatopsis sp. SID8362]NED41577.1 hypothetical protein [Amycolatopsis sp. SID8362]
MRRADQRPQERVEIDAVVVAVVAPAGEHRLSRRYQIRGQPGFGARGRDLGHLAFQRQARRPAEPGADLDAG